jgi:acetoin utilization protein AcuA
MRHLEQPATDEQYYGLFVCSADRAYPTPAGTIYLRDRCPASFIEQLSIDDGLHAFARRPEREYELLLQIARSDTGELALAYTGAGVIIGQLTLADAGAWWCGRETVREVALEVSADWRRLGVARRLIELVMTREELERWILLGMGFSWHWETEELGLQPGRYREMLARLAAPYGFTEYLTTEPNIRDNTANILLARLGNCVEQSALRQFYHCLMRSDTLPGM